MKELPIPQSRLLFITLLFVWQYAVTAQSNTAVSTQHLRRQEEQSHFKSTAERLETAMQFSQTRGMTQVANHRKAGLFGTLDGGDLEGDDEEEDGRRL
jgi:hypothetical protein